MLVLNGSQMAPWESSVYKVGGQTKQFQVTVVGTGLSLELQQWSGTYNASDLAFTPPESEFVVVRSFSGVGGTFIVNGVFNFVRFVLNSGTVTRVYYQEIPGGDLLPESSTPAAFVSDSGAASFPEVNAKINEILVALRNANLMEGS